jgi:hypothetical protein
MKIHTIKQAKNDLERRKKGRTKPKWASPTTQTYRYDDVLFPCVKGEIVQLLGTLLPQHNFNLNHIQGHEEIASFLCALTALYVVAGKCVAAGDQRLGYIVLPPLEFWGGSTAGSSKWARDTLRDNWAIVRQRFSYTRLYKDNKPWTP